MHSGHLGCVLSVGSVVVRGVHLLLFVGYVCYFLFLLFGGLLVCLWWVQGGKGEEEERGGELLRIRDSNSLPFCRQGIPPRRLVWPPYTLDRSLDRSYSGVSRFSAAGA